MPQLSIRGHGDAKCTLLQQLPSYSVYGTNCGHQTTRSIVGRAEIFQLNLPVEITLYGYNKYGIARLVFHRLVQSGHNSGHKWERDAVWQLDSDPEAAVKVLGSAVLAGHSGGMWTSRDKSMTRRDVCSKSGNGSLNISDEFLRLNLMMVTALNRRCTYKRWLSSIW